MKDELNLKVGKFFNNKRLLIEIQNILLSILMVFGAIAVYILSDGGSLQNLIDQIRAESFTFSLISAYMILSSVMVSNAAFNQASQDEYDSNSKIRTLKESNAEKNDQLDDVRYVNEFVKKYNEDRYQEAQEYANEEKLRKLRSKLFSLDTQLKLKRVNAKLNRETNKFKRLILYFKKRYMANQRKTEKKIALIESGKANAKVRGFKKVKRKDFTSIELETDKLKNDLKLKSNIKKQTLLKSLSISAIVNVIASFGIVAALQSLLDYNFQDNWVGIVAFMVFYILLLITKYLINYVSNRRAYKNDTERVLQNRNNLLKKCINFVESAKIERNKKAEQTPD